MTTPTDQIGILSPPVVEVLITSRDGEQVRPYKQSELTLRETGALIEYLALLVTDPSNRLDLNKLMVLDLEDAEGLSSLITDIVRLGPEVVAKLIAIILGAPDDAEWLLDNLKPREILPIIKRFLSQNDVPELLQGFFDLQAELGQVIARHTTLTEESKQS